MSNLKQGLTIGGIASVLAVVASMVLNTLGLWDRSINLAAEEERRLTSLEERLIGQQRQIGEVKTLVADLRKEFLVEGARANNISIQRLNDRFNILNEKIESLPIGLDGGVNKRAIEEAVQAAENRLTQRFSVQIGGLVDGAVQKAVENHVASIPASVGNEDVPIATVRKIHIAGEECVYLPSLGENFTLKFGPGTEFCISPSLLYARVESVGSSGSIWFSGPKFENFTCHSVTGDNCTLGKASGIKRYVVRLERLVKEQGRYFGEYNFEEIPL